MDREKKGADNFIYNAKRKSKIRVRGKEYKDIIAVTKKLFSKGEFQMKEVKYYAKSVGLVRNEVYLGTSLKLERSVSSELSEIR